MSNGTTLLLVALTCVGCVVSCVLIGRHYERKCADHRAYCDEMEHSAYELVTSAQREHTAREAQTEFLPRVPRARLPESRDSDDPDLLTRGQRTLYARAQGKHALPDGSSAARPTDRGEP